MWSIAEQYDATASYLFCNVRDWNEQRLGSRSVLPTRAAVPIGNRQPTPSDFPPVVRRERFSNAPSRSAPSQPSSALRKSKLHELVAAARPSSGRAEFAKRPAAGQSFSRARDKEVLIALAAGV
jgi:hypothetical protein